VTNKTGILNLEVVEGPALSELVESGVECTICVFKLINGEWLEGFAESICFNRGDAIIRVLNAHDGQRYFITYSTTTRKGRVEAMA